MTDNPSKRIVLQRLRNRRLEACELLAGGDAAVRLQGWAEYFNGFYFYFPDEGRLERCQTETVEENEAFNAVLAIMNAACEATDDIDSSDEELISTGWPKRVQPVALEAVQVLLRRGRFNEEIEQDEPDEQRR